MQEFRTQNRDILGCKQATDELCERDWERRDEREREELRRDDQRERGREAAWRLKKEVKYEEMKPFSSCVKTKNLHRNNVVFYFILYIYNAQHAPRSIQTNKSSSECVKEKPGWSQLLVTTGS